MKFIFLVQVEFMKLNNTSMKISIPPFSKLYSTNCCFKQFDIMKLCFKKYTCYTPFKLIMMAFFFRVKIKEEENEALALCYVPEYVIDIKL